MYRLVVLLVFSLPFVSCDPARVYENNRDFKDGIWRAADTAVFEFLIGDTTQRYNVILNVRNSIDFETVRVFLDYTLLDPTSATMRKRLLEQSLFDKKSGEPFGESGLGDIYDHHILLEPAIKFPAKGMYKVKLSHMMRTDSLREILSVGIRAEKAQ